MNAFSIKREYIDHIHTVNNISVVIYKGVDIELKRLLKELLGLKQMGIDLFFADVDAIIDILDM